MYGRVLLFLLGHRLAGNPFQFFFSHLLVLSFFPGFAAGFANAKLFHNKVVRFTGVVPVIVLLLSVLTGPGMYPTMLWESDFRQAFHFFFGGGINIENDEHCIAHGIGADTSFEYWLSLPLESTAVVT